MVAKRIILLLTFIGLMMVYSSLVFASNSVSGVRTWPSPSNTRVVFDLSDAPRFSYFTLRNPERLVIDMDNTAKHVDFSKVPLDGKRIKTIRTSKAKSKNSIRVVLELSEQYKNEVFSLEPSAPYGHRLVVDIKDKAQPKYVSKSVVGSNKDIIIAVDAGHGGEDPGSIGVTGRFEKHVTLAIAKELARKIDATEGMKAVLIRTGDYYIHPNKRPEMARQQNADLLVSVHADAFTSPQPRGASVWVLSLSRANTELGRLVERGEKHSELIGGNTSNTAEVDEYLNLTLFDLEMGHSMESSFEVSQRVIRELTKITKMHKKRPQHASLAVLKAPDVPSLLVETGFISNPIDEKNLMSSNHQKKLATAIFNGIKGYFLQNPPKDTLFYAKRSVTHKVKRGESLSLLASRYNVDVKLLKQANNLSSDMVRIGQVLTIPRS